MTKFEELSRMWDDDMILRQTGSIKGFLKKVATGIEALEKENAELKAQVGRMDKIVWDLQRENAELKAHFGRMDKIVWDLQRENETLKARVAEMEKEKVNIKMPDDSHSTSTVFDPSQKCLRCGGKVHDGFSINLGETHCKFCKEFFQDEQMIESQNKIIRKLTTDRREKFIRAALEGLIKDNRCHSTHEDGIARLAIMQADAVIKILDAEKAIVGIDMAKVGSERTVTIPYCATCGRILDAEKEKE